jgi:hypothetical protein
LCIRAREFASSIKRSGEPACLVMWYRFEAKEIGPEQAFWGVVYRILDEPTDLDVRCILEWVERDWRRIHDGLYSDPTKNKFIKEGEELLI